MSLNAPPRLNYAAGKCFWPGRERGGGEEDGAWKTAPGGVMEEMPRLPGPGGGEKQGLG